MADATIELPKGLKTLTGTPEISRYFNAINQPYTDVSEVLAENPVGIRYINQTFSVAGNKEYWFETGTADGDLKLKSVDVINSLGYIPEDEANKAIDFSVINDTLYPSVKAVEDRLSNFNSVIERDIISDVTAGAIDPGDTVLENLTLTEFAEQLLLKTFFPTFVSPAFSGTTPAKEVGTDTVPISMQYTPGAIVGNIVGGIWNPGVAQGPRAGARNKVWIDGVDNGTALAGTKNQLTTLGTNTVPIKVDYDAGMQPTDSKGNNYLTALPPGSITNNVTWTGFYYRTGISGTTVPTATDIRNNYTTRRTSGGILNLATGTTAKRFDIFVPQGSILSSAIDEGNLNLDITSEFVLQTDFSGLDANGDVVMYKHYLRQVGNAYTASSNLKITVT